MAGDSTGRGGYYEGSSASLNSGGTEWNKVLHLPLFQIQFLDEIHPFLRLLAGYSAHFFAEGIDNFHETEKVTQRPRRFFDTTVPHRETLKPLHYPTDKDRTKPRNVPEYLLKAFLDSVKNYNPDNSRSNPFEGDERVMNYAILENGWRDISIPFWYFMRAMQGNESKDISGDLYTSLSHLWEAFPMCDSRIEFAYRAYRYLKNPKPNSNEPSYLCDLSPFFLKWASKKKISENIAFRHLWEEHIRAKNEESRKPETKLSRIFSFSKNPVRFYNYRPTPADFAEVIDLHRKLLTTGGREHGYARQLPDAYKTNPFVHKKDKDEKKQAVIDSYDELATQFFFERLYINSYREGRGRQVGFEPMHPLYNAHDSFDATDLVWAIDASIAQEFYSLRDVNYHTVKPTKDRPYYLTDDQQSMIVRLSPLEDNAHRTNISLIIHEYQNSSSNRKASYYRLSQNIIDPRAHALYRIFNTEGDFKEKLRSIGVPFETEDKFLVQKMNGHELVTEMEDLITWMNEPAINHSNDNKNAIATLYLAAEIKKYLIGYTGREYCQLAEKTARLFDKEVINVTKCPELLLVAFADAFGEPNFDDLQTFSFAAYESELQKYRFGEKRFVRRSEFIDDFLKLMDNYRYINSGQWSIDLEHSLNEYKKSLQNLTAHNNELSFPRPKVG